MDTHEILTFLEGEGIIRTAGQTGNYMKVHCPFHSDGNEKRPSCGVLLTDEYRAGRTYPSGFWHCFACHYAKPMNAAVDDLIRTKNIPASAVKWLRENVEPPDDPDLLVPNALMGKMIEKYAVEFYTNIENKVQYVSEEELQSYRFTVPYMYERKMTDELIAKFDVGYDGNWIPPGRKKPVPCITFPVRDMKGRTPFLCRRSIVGKLYNYPEGVEKPLYGIYELPPRAQTILIVESCINAITAYRYGKCAVALLGTGNQLQMRQLRMLGASNFVIATDGDEAGRRAAAKLKRELKEVAFVWTMPIPDGKDINDLTEEEFNEIYEKRE